MKPREAKAANRFYRVLPKPFMEEGLYTVLELWINVPPFTLRLVTTATVNDLLCSLFGARFTILSSVKEDEDAFINPIKAARKGGCLLPFFKAVNMC